MSMRPSTTFWRSSRVAAEPQSSSSFGGDRGGRGAEGGGGGGLYVDVASLQGAAACAWLETLRDLKTHHGLLQPSKAAASPNPKDPNPNSSPSPSPNP